MKLFVGVTNNEWFRFLAEKMPDEVNFWQPSGSRQFKVLQPGEHFLFKLHSPDNFIVGGGFFVRYSPLSISRAWDAFQQKNGTSSLEHLSTRVHRYRRNTESLDPVIGCKVLAEPFFLKREDWVPIPASWASNIVQGKTYDTETAEGAQLWQAVQSAAHFDRRIAEPTNNDERARYGREYLTRGRHSLRWIPRASDGCLSVPLRNHGREDAARARGRAYQAVCGRGAASHRQRHSAALGSAQVV